MLAQAQCLGPAVMPRASSIWVSASSSSVVTLAVAFCFHISSCLFICCLDRWVLACSSWKVFALKVILFDRRVGSSCLCSSLLSFVASSLSFVAGALEELAGDSRVGACRWGNERALILTSCPYRVTTPPSSLMIRYDDFGAKPTTVPLSLRSPSFLGLASAYTKEVASHPNGTKVVGLLFVLYHSVAGVVVSGSPWWMERFRM